MYWVKVKPGTWRSGDYEIWHMWFSVRETYDLYFKGKPISAHESLEEAKEAAKLHQE